jgi:hypothetical protein
MCWLAFNLFNGMEELLGDVVMSNRGPLAAKPAERADAAAIKQK